MSIRVDRYTTQIFSNKYYSLSLLGPQGRYAYLMRKLIIRKQFEKKKLRKEKL